MDLNSTDLEMLQFACIRGSCSKDLQIYDCLDFCLDASADGKPHAGGHPTLPGQLEPLPTILTTYQKPLKVPSIEGTHPLRSFVSRGPLSSS